MTATDLPTSMRRLDTPEAQRLARLVAAYDDVQIVLRCCERLVETFAGEHDDVDVEALWTLALLSYGRMFSERNGESVLTEDDLIEAVTSVERKDAAETAPDPDKLREWHRVIMHLRDHHADPAVDPRETYTTGVALDADGKVSAVGVTSVRAPSVDEAAARQAGAITYPLIAVLDERIDVLQQKVFVQTRELDPATLAELDEIEVADSP